MNEILEQMIAQLEKLPETEKNAIANRLLAELDRNSITHRSGCLDDVINLVDQWLAEDSQYDEEVYPQLEIALLNHTVSIQSNFLNE